MAQGCLGMFLGFIGALGVNASVSMVAEQLSGYMGKVLGAIMAIA